MPKAINDYGIFFNHINDYVIKEGKVNSFKDDMEIRLQNLVSALYSHNLKIFFRKSHSDKHHNSPSREKPDDNREYAIQNSDIDDLIDLHSYLPTVGITNFRIVLFLCCGKCYKSNERLKELIDLDILCFNTFENGDERLTIPKQFTDFTYPLFKGNVILKLKTEYETVLKDLFEKQTLGSRANFCTDNLSILKFLNLGDICESYIRPIGSFNSRKGGGQINNNNSMKKYKSKKIKKSKLKSKNISKKQKK